SSKPPINPAGVQTASLRVDAAPPRAANLCAMNVRDVFPATEPPDAPPPAFDLLRPAGGETRPPPTPFVFASPHSGWLCPVEVLAASVLGSEDIRRSGVAFVARLIPSGPRDGAVVIAARYARAYVDLNREAWELAPAMFEDEV